MCYSNERVILHAIFDNIRLQIFMLRYFGDLHEQLTMIANILFVHLVPAIENQQRIYE